VRLGLPASLEREVPLPWAVEAAVRLDGGLLFHPRKYCLGLAGALPGAGSHVFEGSRVGEIEQEGRCVVHTPGGRVEADHVVVATLLPFGPEGGFFAKAHPSRSYAMAVRVEGPGPEGMFLSADSPTRSVRPHTSDDGTLLVVEGEEHKTGHETDTEGRYAAVERWARERFAVQSVAQRWSAQDFMSPDRVPYVGRASAGSERLLVATSFGKWGMSNGTAAAMMLTDLVLGRPNDWLELFDATRLKPGTTTAQLVKDNLDVARRFVGDRLATLRPRPIERLAPGEGAIVELEGERVAAFRDEQGRMSACSAVCTHMGCLVSWNPAERSWDCPCHGSRFDTEGRVLEGPAVRDLEPRPVPQLGR
jgi:Rieske Fe-S protein